VNDEYSVLPFTPPAFPFVALRKYGDSIIQHAYYNYHYRENNPSSFLLFTRARKTRTRRAFPCTADNPGSVTYCDIRQFTTSKARSPCSEFAVVRPIYGRNLKERNRRYARVSLLFYLCYSLRALIMRLSHFRTQVRRFF